MEDILLVEDQEELAELIRIFLEKDGYRVIHAASGEEALEFLEYHKVRIMILDLMLPGMDGFAVCRTVREQWNLPIIIISALSDREDKLNGYGLGADDYVEKPVDMDILTAKVKVLLQRAYSTRAGDKILKSGGITIYRESRKVCVEGKQIELNAKEFDLLMLLAENPDKTLHKDYIFSRIWGMDSNSESQTLTVHIQMLRSKIEKNPRRPERIQTVWGIGYRYEEI